MKNGIRKRPLKLRALVVKNRPRLVDAELKSNEFEQLIRRKLALRQTAILN